MRYGGYLEMLLGEPWRLFFFGISPSGEGRIRGGFRIVTSFGCRDISLGIFNIVLSAICLILNRQYISSDSRKITNFALWAKVLDNAHDSWTVGSCS